MQMSTTATDLN